MNRLRKKARQLYLRKAERYAWAYMIYKCEDCGWETKMYLENTLERHDEGHKPVPFMIRCPKCHGFHCQDISGTNVIFKDIPIGCLDNYFKDDPNYDCGIPVIKKV